MQYNMGLTSVSSYDDDIRDVSNSKSNTNWSTQAQLASAKREEGLTLVKHEENQFIYITENNKI